MKEYTLVWCDCTVIVSQSKIPNENLWLRVSCNKCGALVKWKYFRNVQTPGFLDLPDYPRCDVDLIQRVKKEKEREK